MYTRVLNYFYPATKEIDEAKAVDFRVTAFDPANREHRKCIDAKINHFNKSYNLLVKTDIIIIVPFALDLLLMVGRVLGLGMSLLVCAGISSVLYASEQFQNHKKYQKEFQEQLLDLLAIYRTCVKQKSADMTDDQTILKIVQTISPFLDSEQLVNWKANQTYPDPNFSDKFMEILSAPPHKIPRVMLKGDMPVKTEETQISQAGVLRLLTNATTNNRWVDLYKSSLANLNFTMYGCHPAKKEEEKTQNGILQLLKL